MAIRLLARLHLDEVGGEVIEAADAETARALLAGEPPFEMVVADHRLPSNESGIDLLTTAASQFPTTAMFVMSAHMSPEATRRASEAGLGVVDKIDLQPIVDAWRAIVTANPDA